MSYVPGYVHWRASVWMLLKESGHRMDEKGPRLTAGEVKEMEAQYTMGDSPEDFVAWLNQRDALRLVG